MLRVRSRSALWAVPIVAGCSFGLVGACSAGKSAGEEPGSGAASGSGGSAGSGAGAGGQAGDGGASGAAATGAVGGVGGTAGVSGSSAGGASGAGATSGSGGNGGSGASAADGDVPNVTFSYDAPVVQNEACATTKVEAQQLPLDIYIILDMSGSMHCPDASLCLGNGDCDVGQNVNSKWCRCINALYGFFAAGTSVGMGVALQFFSGSSCAALSSPAVPLQILPGHLTQLQIAMNGINPNGGTPTNSAASGIVAFTAANQTPGRKMIGILITDGDPTDCGDANAIGTTLGTHFTNTGIPTFVVGMDGASFGNLEAMAAPGGAASHANYCGGGINPCHFYNVGNGDPNAFIDALKSIQQQALGCEFLMPTTDAGIINPNDVKVFFTPSGGSPAELPNVPNAGACGSNNGWYFDNPASPTKIFLCPTTCTSVQADINPKIDIELGCLGS